MGRRIGSWLGALASVIFAGAARAETTSIDAGVPDAGVEDGTPVAMYGVREVGCASVEGAAAPSLAAAGLALLRRRRKGRRS